MRCHHAYAVLGLLLSVVSASTPSADLSSFAALPPSLSSVDDAHSLAASGTSPSSSQLFSSFVSPRRFLQSAATEDAAAAASLSSGLSFFPAFFNSWSLIIATELGDKTFFIAAVLSMRLPRSPVFLGAFTALVVMTVLSTAMGMVMPALVSRQYTHLVGGLLFLYFGVKLLNDSRSLEDKVSDELHEVEEELAGVKKVDGDDDAGGAKVEDVEAGGKELNCLDDDDAATSSSSSSSAAVAQSGGDHRAASQHSFPGARFLSASASVWEATFVQSLTLTFLAEWGDRSQIATISLAAVKDPMGVTLGGILGHAMCTGLAVVGGKMLATKISAKSAAIGGGAIFLLFGIHALLFDNAE